MADHTSSVHETKVTQFRPLPSQIFNFDNLINLKQSPAPMANKVVGADRRFKVDHPSMQVKCISDVILEKVYFSPLEIALGLIVESSVHNIDVWNAFKTQDLTITNINLSSGSGVALGAETPILLGAGNEIRHELTVLEQGPAIQNTIVTYVIGSITFTLVVTGKRILVFAHEPGQLGMRLSYTFDTRFFRNDFFVEARTPLLGKAIINMQSKFHVQAQEARDFLNELKAKYNGLVGFMIYTEPIFINSNINGVSLITPSNPAELPIEFYYNLQHTTNLCVLITENNPPEIKTIVEVSSTTILFEQPVSGDVTEPLKAVIFPVMLGIMKEKNVTMIHDSSLLAELDFEQKNVEG